MANSTASSMLENGARIIGYRKVGVAINYALTVK